VDWELLDFVKSASLDTYYAEKPWFINQEKPWFKVDGGFLVGEVDVASGNTTIREFQVEQRLRTAFVNLGKRAS
jgi:hypothetical protein